MHGDPDFTESGPTDTGRTPRGSDDTNDMTPCASSSPRTTRASTSEAVVKMVTKSDIYLAGKAGRAWTGGKRELRIWSDRPLLPFLPILPFPPYFVDLEQDHGHVVVLRSVADERRDFRSMRSRS
jgi:hypothetical protein